MPKTMYEGKEVKYIDITPTWKAIVNSFLPLYPDMNAEGRRTLKEQFMRMA